MEFIDLLLKRRSVRKFSEENVAKKDLDRILQAGLLAPTSRNRKPCNFLIVENRTSPLIGYPSLPSLSGTRFPLRSPPRQYSE